jgi:hypothetical protein
MAGEQSAAAWPQSRAIGRSDQGDLVTGPLLRPGGIGHSLRTSPCSSWPRSIVRISRDCPRRRAPARDRVAQFLWRSRRDRRVWLGRPKPVRDRSGRGTPRFILTLMDTAYRRKCVHIASTTSFSVAALGSGRSVLGDGDRRSPDSASLAARRQFRPWRISLLPDEWRRPCRPPLRPQPIRRASDVMGTRRSSRACSRRWRAGQDKTANTYVLEISL